MTTTISRSTSTKSRSTRSDTTQRQLESLREQLRSVNDELTDEMRRVDELLVMYAETRTLRGICHAITDFCAIHVMKLILREK